MPFFIKELPAVLKPDPEFPKLRGIKKSRTETADYLNFATIFTKPRTQVLTFWDHCWHQTAGIENFKLGNVFSNITVSLTSDVPTSIWQIQVCNDMSWYQNQVLPMVFEKDLIMGNEELFKLKT